MKFVEKILRKIIKRETTYFVTCSGEYENTGITFTSQGVITSNVNRKMSFEDFKELRTKMENLMKEDIEETQKTKVKNIIVTNIINIKKL